MQNLKFNLRYLRNKNYYTQSQIAQLIKISLRNYSKLEKGESTPKLETLIKLSNVYNVSLDFLVNNDFTKDIN